MTKIALMLTGFLFWPLTARAEALLQDVLFKRGYQVISPQRDAYTRRIEVEAIHGKDPAWRLVQWGSVGTLADAKEQAAPRGGKQWLLPIAEDDRGGSYKRVILEPDGELVLELNALARFTASHYQRLDGEDLYLDALDQYWPHLLMAQSLATKKLSEYRQLDLSLDALLLFDHRNLRAGHDPALHAARFPVILGVRNTLSRQMFWLSLTIYDDRTPDTGFNCRKCLPQKEGTEQCHTARSLDEPGRWDCPFDGIRWKRDVQKTGTGKMIFRIPTVVARNKAAIPGEWQHYEVDLLPYLRAGVQAARDSSSSKGFSPELRFYELSHFSLGWEITGLNHAAMAVKNLSLTGE